MDASTGGSPTVSRLALANSLRQLRLGAHRTLDEAAAALEVSGATISRYENGIRIPRARDVRDLCRFYDVNDETRIAQLAGLVVGAREPGWWESYSEVDDEAYSLYIGLEAAATSIKEYQANYVPGILQTVEYAEAFMMRAASLTRYTPYTDHDVAKLIEVRVRRQELLKVGTKLRYQAIVDEAALRRPVGGGAVMHKQIEHLLDLADRESVDLAVLPFSSDAHPGQLGAFIILHVPTDAVADIVYIDSMAGQFMIDEAAEVERYRTVLERMIDLALEGGVASDFLKALADEDPWR